MNFFQKICCLSSFSLCKKKNIKKMTYPILTRKNKPTMGISTFKEKYNFLGKGIRLMNESKIVLCGRISSTPRESSKSLFFFEIVNKNEKIQVVAQRQNYSSNDILDEPNFTKQHRGLRKGDIVSIQGFPGKTKVGELSLFSSSLQILSFCLRDIPSGRGDGINKLSDKDIRYRYRHLDLLSDRETASRPFFIRSSVISFLRKYLEKLGFMEVETPILSHSSGGALAEPFETKYRVIKESKLSLRISPELYLKQLVVGGFENIFEIGKIFRNEGLSPYHNPEFTSCELYAAYHDHEDMMKLTENIISEVAINTLGTLSLDNGINLKPPFKRLSIIPELEKLYNASIPDLNNIHEAQQTYKFLKSILEVRHGIKQEVDNFHPTLASNCNLFNELIGLDLESKCVETYFSM